MIFFLFASALIYQQIPTNAHSIDLADSREVKRKFLAFSIKATCRYDTIKVNNSSSKISDVSFEWISANLDQISLYVGLSIFAKRVLLDEWKEKTFFAFVFPLSSGFGYLDLFLCSTIARVVIHFA